MGITTREEGRGKDGKKQHAHPYLQINYESELWYRDLEADWGHCQPGELQWYKAGDNI